MPLLLVVALQGGLVHKGQRARISSLVRRFSSATEGLPASEIEHAVEDIDGDAGFDLLGRSTMGAQGVADDVLVSTHHPLHPDPHIVVQGSLPTHPDLLGNDLDVAIALGRIGFC
jgi:hypothetical protein